MTSKQLKKAIVRAYKSLHEQGEDALATSMLHRERTLAEGEAVREYGFILPDEIIFDYDPERNPTEWDAYLDLTEEEIREWVNDNMVIRIYSDYDCTGRAFTKYVNWHRNPCGLISYVHTIGYDI